MENKFPHHECEIAQSEAANGVQFVRYWIHNNMVTVDGQKMGKSLDNFITLKQAFGGVHERLTRNYDPLAIRQLILNSHYRSPLDFSDAALFAAQSGFEKVTEAVKALRRQIPKAGEGEADRSVKEELKKLREKFEAAMDDDLNTSVALSVVFELVRVANRLLEENNANAETFTAAEELFSELGGDVLGIVKEEYETSSGTEDKIIETLIECMIERRNDARKRKDFAAADGIRDKLAELEIIIEDKPEATEWRRK